MVMIKLVKKCFVSSNCGTEKRERIDQDFEFLFISQSDLLRDYRESSWKNMAIITLVKKCFVSSNCERAREGTARIQAHLWEKQAEEFPVRIRVEVAVLRLNVHVSVIGFTFFVVVFLLGSGIPIAWGADGKPGGHQYPCDIMKARFIMN